MTGRKENKQGFPQLQVPYGEAKVLLHTCCAPCSSAIVECLCNNNVDFVIYYANANIFPEEEFVIRRDECRRYADALGIEMVIQDYDHNSWLETVKGLEKEPERGSRCLKCFKARLTDSARYAAANGIRVLTTTLASSRWKSLDQINKAGAEACELVNRELGLPPDKALVWWEQNWRKGGLQERRNQIIKEMDFYNQLYCGCEFSINNELLK